jgi:hypothetical protein
VLEFLEEGRLDHCEADADAASVAYPHEAGFGLKRNLAARKDEVDVEQT